MITVVVTTKRQNHTSIVHKNQSKQHKEIYLYLISSEKFHNQAFSSDCNSI